MATELGLSRRERQILDILHTRGQATVAEVHRALPDAPGYSAFGNFLDDYSGARGTARKDFGATLFHPDQFHQTYFFQDTWLPLPSLSLTLGLRYENFGQVANALQQCPA